MFKVLVAVDGSPIAKQTLEFARDLLAGKETAVTLFHVIPQHMIYGRAVVPAEVYDMPAERAASTALLEQNAQYLQEGGVGPTIERHIAVGDPAELILTAASDQDADLIILGSRGLNAAQRFLVGSTSTKVTTHAQCAVLVVHPKETAAAASASDTAASWATTD
jgi:nucleotide-binding universal stress UspA family protein